MAEDRRARKVDVSDKPGSHQWTSEEYAGNGGAAHARKLQVCPFAVDEDDSGSRPSSARGSSRAGSEAGNSQQSYHHAAAVLPSGKVGSNSFVSENYTNAREASAALKQQRFDKAASAAAPFAVSAGDGGMAGAPSGDAYQYNKPQQAEPAAKVGAGGHAYNKPQQVEPAAKVGAGGHKYHKPQLVEPSDKVGGAAWDQQAVENACRVRNAEQAASRLKNRGTPNLLS